MDIIKKLIFKAAIVIFVSFAGASYFAYQKTGEVPVFNRQLLKKIDPIKEFVRSMMTTPESDLKTHPETHVPNPVYRWKNGRGELRFGDTPPENATHIERITDLKINTIDMTVTTKQAKTIQPETTGPKSASTTETLPIPTYSPKQIKKFMEQARDAKEIMDAHHQQLNELQR